MHKNYVYTCDAFYLKFCYEKGEPPSGNNIQSLHSNCCVASEISGEGPVTTMSVRGKYIVFSTILKTSCNGVKTFC